VVAALHHVSAVLLLDEKVDTLDTAVLVLGYDREATGPCAMPARWRP